MLYDFIYDNPTKIYFGKNSLNNLYGELIKYGKNVLLAYGGGSIKRYGLYDKIKNILNKANKNVFELSNILPNPSYSKLLEGVEIVRKNNIDFILAVGGGSVIDCVKGISAGSYHKGDIWQDLYINQKPVTSKVIPIGTILTMAGTGSEANGGSVITNDDVHIKKGRVYPSLLYPKFSILNPELTYTVPTLQVISGIFDTISHLLEQYFSGDDDNTSDYLIEALLRSEIHSSYLALKDMKDYIARSNLMWNATLALNTLVGCAKSQDWQVHSIEHQLSAYTNCSHGLGLAAISIPYYKHIYKYGLDKFVKFAINVFNINSSNKDKQEIALEGISKLKDYIKDLGCPLSIKELGAKEEQLQAIADSTDLGGGYKDLTSQEVLMILEESYNYTE